MKNNREMAGKIQKVCSRSISDFQAPRYLFINWLGSLESNSALQAMLSYPNRFALVIERTQNTVEHTHTYFCDIHVYVHCTRFTKIVKFGMDLFSTCDTFLKETFFAVCPV